MRPRATKKGVSRGPKKDTKAKIRKRQTSRRRQAARAQRGRTRNSGASRKLKRR